VVLSAWLVKQNYQHQGRHDWLTKALAREVASRKVTVNALALGMVATDMASALDESYQTKILEQIPLADLLSR